MIYPIVAYGDPVLRKMARPVEKGTDLTELVANMLETMHNADGVGLAAPQIGLDLRLFVVDGSGTEDEVLKPFKQVFVNPQILDQAGDPWGYEEGCLSLPGIREEVKRQAKLRIRFFDEHWQEYEAEFDGLRARVIQHEYDHIEGKLFIDHLSPLRRRLLNGKLNDILKGKAKADYRLRYSSAKR
ncbi:MAG: peptide deformylase [Bernardetiaceae bacterium]|jgi:peptide deformylase|nr:peptide deformylase [Bernardetiaceae bacterium]